MKGRYSYHILRQVVTDNFMRYLRDGERAFHFRPFTGCTCPRQRDFAVEDRDQSKKVVIKYQRQVQR